MQRVTQGASSPINQDSEEEDSEDVPTQDLEVDEEPVPVQKAKKRRPKKVVPLGSNGLKKKRVMKSRQTTDAKGYMSRLFLPCPLGYSLTFFLVFEDYSSYESVGDGEEPEPVAPSKGKAKAKPSKNTEEDSSTAPPPKLKLNATSSTASKPIKPAKSGAQKGGQPKQKKLANFFMAPAKVKD